MLKSTSKLCLLLGILAASSAAAENEAMAPDSCDPGANLDKIVLSSKVPCDVAGGVAGVTAQNAANFAWNTFLAMNWPAAAPFEPSKRGVPRQSQTAAQANSQDLEARINTLNLTREALLRSDGAALKQVPQALTIALIARLQLPEDKQSGLEALGDAFHRSGYQELWEQALTVRPENLQNNPRASMALARIEEALRGNSDLQDMLIAALFNSPEEVTKRITDALVEQLREAKKGIQTQQQTATGPWFNAGDTSVWSTWPEKRELFRVRKDAFGSTFHYEKPLPFNQVGTDSVQPNTEIAMCSSGDAPPKHLPSLQNAKIENYVDETDEVQIAILWEAGSNDLTEENLVRYQVKVNYDHYNDVLTKNWWDGTTLPEAIKTQQESGNGIGVVLASGTNENGGKTGAILSKSAWKFLDGNLNNVSSYGNYYTQEALYYKIDEEGAPCFETGIFGLIGLHIIRKTDAFPYLFFSTFEHNKNYPNQFLYANTKLAGRHSTPENPLFVSTLKNPHGIEYQWPQDPAPNKSSQRTPPYSATRLIQKSQAVQTANTEAEALTQGTVWANYSLVGVQTFPVSAPGDRGNAYTQGAPVGHGGTGLHPSYDSKQEFYLANPVIETNQRFQFFVGSFADQEANNVIRYEGDNPNIQNVGSKVIQSGEDAGTLAFDINMGGCMGCHGRAQKAGFSFSLKGAIGLPTMATAETLKTKCVGEDADVFGDYNPETGVCTLLRTAACEDAVCKVNIPASDNCVLAAVTNTDQNWTIDLSYEKNGSAFFTGTGSGLNNAPVRWTKGSAVFETTGKPVYVSYKIAGAKGTIIPVVQARTGAAIGTQTTLFGAKGTGEESTFADMIASLSCQSK
ncbi:hypothetical protein [Hoeflea sp.]|uniref:hypothetical protein n=1 Tax=Hoeflea sp. TaxID=1940281 RepID=UPI003748D08E